MGEKMPVGATADYYQVALADAHWCGHPHRSIESAVRCFHDSPGAVAVVAIRKRTDAIGTARLYNKDMQYLTASQVQRLIEWEERNRHR